ncbi:ATP-binding Cassette (ABC) Superfamily, partial [Thraustotheca clavata]
MIHYISQPHNALLIEDATHHIAQLPAYHVSYAESTKQLFSRQMTVFLRNKEFVYSRLVMILLMGFLYSTSYYQVDPGQIVNVLGVIFAAVLFLALGQIPMIPAIVEAREIFYKQRSANFFRTSSFILAQCTTQIPFAFIETIIFGTIMYWVTGFTSSSGAFLTYLLLLFLVNLTFITWFFFLSSISPNLHVAEPVALVSVLFFVLFSGFVMSADDTPAYFIWIYWIDPLAWSIRALAINQYTADEFQQCVYKGFDYCATQNATFGDAMLQQFGLKTGKEWIWYAVIYLAVCYFVFMFFAYLALEYIHYDHSEHTIIVNEDEEENNEKDVDVYVAAPKTPANDQVQVAIPVQPSTHRISTPVTLAFKDLWYSVPNPTKGEPDLQLLKGINGYALPGTITALMGSSGAGKTTLMDVI